MKKKYIPPVCTIRKFVRLLKALLGLALLVLEMIKRIDDLLE